MTVAHILGILSSLFFAAFAEPISEPVDVADIQYAPTSAAEAKRIFSQRCAACHNYGKGIKVGPDLKGVTERRDRTWLVKFIRSSQSMVKAGDPIALELFARFKQQRMPDWTDLSEHQIESILDWFRQNGPEQKEPDEVAAALATQQDLDKGRNLFTGQIPLANGGLPCINCHTLRAGPGAAKMPIGGTLGRDLTLSYFRYQDRAMTLFLKRPCNSRVPERGKYLQPRESFALKAIMRNSGLSLLPGNRAVPLPASPSLTDRKVEKP